MNHSKNKLLFTLFTLSTLSGCLDEADSTEEVIIGNVACGPEHATPYRSANTGSNPTTILNVAEFGDGSNIEFVENNTVTQSGLLPSTDTDIAISGRGEYFYRLGRQGIDTIQKYYRTAPEVGLYQTENGLGYSTRDAGTDTSPNAKMIGFINDSIAILPRRETSNAWVVNLDAQTESEFKICELDLSAYETESITNEGTDEETVVTYPPHMELVNVTENYAAITMQRLDNYTAVNSAYTAIFDLNTWQEVDTQPDTNGLKGIELNLKNPQQSTLTENDLYISSVIWQQSGGIEKIDLDTFTATIINEESGYWSIESAENGNIYAIGVDGWDYKGLFEIQGDTRSVVGNTSEQTLTTLTSRENVLWVGYKGTAEVNAKVEIYSAITNDLEGTVDSLPRSPQGISFIED
jgi:hypothetical protein